MVIPCVQMYGAPTREASYDVWRHIRDPRTHDQREADERGTRKGTGNRRRETVEQGLRADAYALIHELMARHEERQRYTQQPFRCVCADIADNAR